MAVSRIQRRFTSTLLASRPALYLTLLLRARSALHVMLGPLSGGDRLKPPRKKR
jgi:hypothetical protein